MRACIHLVEPRLVESWVLVLLHVVLILGCVQMEKSRLASPVSGRRAPYLAGAPLKKQVLACPSILIEEPRGSLPFWLHFTIETALNRAESASIVLVREAWISFPNRVSFATWLSVAYLLQDGSMASKSFERLAWEINLDALPIRHKAL